MAKKLSGLQNPATYRYGIDCSLSDVSTAGVRAILNKFKELEVLTADEIAVLDPSNVAQQLGMATPYSELDCSVIIDLDAVSPQAQIEVAVVGDTVPVVDSLGRAALSTRRQIKFNFNDTGNAVPVRGIQAALNFVEGLEDLVAANNDGAAGDATYTDIELAGATPYETFTATVVKLGNVYTVTLS